MVSARGVLRTEGFLYALDNGAWTAHQQDEDFDVAAFEKALGKLGADADFIVVPDIVAGGMKSLDFSMSWLDRLMTLGGPRLLVAVQDGMTPGHLAGVVSDRVGIFLGGSTEWKLSTLTSWGKFARKKDIYFHVGRVNTSRRIAHCSAWADSFDGSGPSRFYKELSRLDTARRQISWPM